MREDEGCADSAIPTAVISWRFLHRPIEFSLCTMDSDKKSRGIAEKYEIYLPGVNERKTTNKHTKKKKKKKNRAGVYETLCPNICLPLKITWNKMPRSEKGHNLVKYLWKFAKS